VAGLLTRVDRLEPDNATLSERVRYLLSANAVNVLLQRTMCVVAVLVYMQWCHVRAMYVYLASLLCCLLCLICLIP
jgi:hypothetical protein